jgi:hypothetical protein
MFSFLFCLVIKFNVSDILTIQEVCVLMCNFPQHPPPPPPKLHMRNHEALWEIIQHFIKQSYLHQAYHPCRPSLNKLYTMQHPGARVFPRIGPCTPTLRAHYLGNAPTFRHYPTTLSPTKPVLARWG